MISILLAAVVSNVLHSDTGQRDYLKNSRQNLFHYYVLFGPNPGGDDLFKARQRKRLKDPTYDELIQASRDKEFEVLVEPSAVVVFTSEYLRRSRSLREPGLLSDLVRLEVNAKVSRESNPDLFRRLVEFASIGTDPGMRSLLMDPNNAGEISINPVLFTEVQVNGKTTKLASVIGKVDGDMPKPIDSGRPLGSRLEKLPEVIPGQTSEISIFNAWPTTSTVLATKRVLKAAEKLDKWIDDACRAEKLRFNRTRTLPFTVGSPTVIGQLSEPYRSGVQKSLAIQAMIPNSPFRGWNGPVNNMQLTPTRMGVSISFVFENHEGVVIGF